MISNRNLRPRQHDGQLTRKSAHINDSLFIIRMLFKDLLTVTVTFTVSFVIFLFLFHVLLLRFVSWKFLYEYMDMDGLLYDIHFK